MFKIKITYFVILLSIISAFGKLICPSGCLCDNNTVRCSRYGPLSIPRIPDETETLDLRYNKLSTIPPNVFAHLSQLRTLMISENELRALRSGVFNGLTQMKVLYAHRNRIEHIDNDVFQGLEQLQHLYMHINLLHSIEPIVFSGMPNLISLFLNKNALIHLPAGSFEDLPKLQTLRLDDNNLQCDCFMRRFFRMLDQNPRIQVTGICLEPPNFSGLQLKEITEADLNCPVPEIMKEPKDVVVNIGDRAMFNCVASGNPNPKITWLRGSNHIPKDLNQYEIMDNGTLIVNDADENDEGFFECMAKNEAGEARSRKARMTVQGTAGEIGENSVTNKNSPVFTVLPKKQVITPKNNTAYFHCVAKGKPKPYIAWFYNGDKIVLSERMSLTKNGSLFITNVTDSDVGTYSCRAQNIYGKVVASVALEIIVAPALLSVPKDQTVTIGDKAHFVCTAQGVPKPKLKWFKNNLLISTSDNILLTDENQHLKIIEVRDSDQGFYLCRAENAVGFKEISAYLKVRQFHIIKPKIVLKPEDTDAFKGTSVQMPCEVESEPPASIDWRKDGARVITNDRISISIVGSLIINNVSLTDTGRYECSVFNEYGRDTESVFLTVKNHVLPGDAYVNIALTEATRDVDKAISKTMEKLFHNNNTKVDIGDLYRITRFPSAPAREIAKSAEIYERTLDKVKEFIQAGLKVTSVEPFNYENILSREHLDVIAQLSGCVAHREDRDCSDTHFHTQYRNIDGSCNNFAHPTWGASLTGFRRIIFPIYENGFSQPPGWNKNMKYNNHVLPSARLVSTDIIRTDEISEDIEITHMTMQWGQWLDHDLDHALPSVSSQTWDGVDCKKTCDYAPPCFPIEVPLNDTRIPNRRCIDFIRTSSVCGSGMTSVLFGAVQPREQINQLTSFIDASQVYGFEKSVAQDLRDLTNNNGTLRVGAKFPGKKPLLPTNGLNGMDCRRDLEESSRNCFVAGDIRANEQIGLAAMHTIWMREHNRLATELKKLNPFWDGEKIYQEARKIVGATIQHITYKQWLPIILGDSGVQSLGEYKGYDSNLNPSISNVFATAALRFGHALINPILHRYDENFEPIPQGHLKLRYAFFSPWRLVDEGGVDPLMRGMFTTPAKLKKPTENLNTELTEQLFFNAHAVALDLAAINVQRGRDHGIPPYTKWRQFCNMSEIENFHDLENEISDKFIRDKLKDLYGSVHNIDVWVGGILEDQMKGSKVGPLFNCLLIEQFQRLRDGDRLWYEHPDTFTPVQLTAIKQTSLARVLCDNGDNIDTISENVFLLPEVQDGLISCEDLPSLDLRYWKDDEEEERAI